MKKYSKITLFPTEVFIFQMETDLTKLLEAVYYIKHKFPKSEVHSNIGGWQSNDYSLVEHEGFKELLTEQGECLKEILKNYHEVSHSLGNSWININKGDDYNELHVHPLSEWSCCMYVQVAGGGITLKDPRPCMHMSKLPALSEEHATTWNLEPITGSLIFFPSFIEHKVLPSNEQLDRITIASNYLVNSEEL